MERYGQIINISTEQCKKYKTFHDDVWPEVLATIKKCNIQNYSIFHKNDVMFTYFEYTGGDFEADMLKMSKDAKIQEWWGIVKPLLEPVTNRREDEFWANMEEIFHLD